MQSEWHREADERTEPTASECILAGKQQQLDDQCAVVITAQDHSQLRLALQIVLKRAMTRTRSINQRERLDNCSHHYSECMVASLPFVECSLGRLARREHSRSHVKHVANETD